MESILVLHMNHGEGETSFAKNSNLRKQLMPFLNSVIEEGVKKCLKHETLTSKGIAVADLGCSSGPNTLTVISNIIDTIQARCSQMGILVPELRVSFNDLPNNDFNYIFRSLPEFYNKIKRDRGIEECFASCVAGSFYGRLFSKNTLHFVHSSYSLHWLSQSPRVLDIKSGVDRRYLNKGNIYISKTSPACVAKAYLAQFQNDFFTFLRSRAEEIVSGGQMVLSFLAQLSPDSQDPYADWELLAQALMTMASQGLVDEEKIDAFNMPYYAASAEEVGDVIQKEGSFTINHLEVCAIGWDHLNNSDDGFDDDLGKLSRGQRYAKNVRAVVEPMLSLTFGTDIMDKLFEIYADLEDEQFSKAIPKDSVLVTSLSRN